MVFDGRLTKGNRADNAVESTASMCSDVTNPGVNGAKLLFCLLTFQVEIPVHSQRGDNFKMCTAYSPNPLKSADLLVI